ncbi:uncharacterized protein LOC131597664 [Vicia villosa]|uniref:uncharacterized protein LOC131597664 n=1 Tax=Vicia villosa TaxID=3911 RepID=UPI00273BBF09|nr:uncharacterized protein LOC131597664 [Vicia villosa]
MVGSRRSRGRPPKTVSPVPANPSSLVVIPVVNTKEDDDEIRKKREPVIDMETVQVETVSESQIGENHKLWVDVISGNWNPAKGRVMKYVAPTVVNGAAEVVLDDDDVASELQLWKNALIVYVIGEDIRYFILRFKQRDDLDAVVMQGPYTIRNMPLLLKTWRPDFNLNDDLLRTLPIWVKLPQFSLHLWEERSLNKIASVIGALLVTNECTTHKLRVSYARVLVEVDITQKLLDEITITDNEGKKRKQTVEYEWRPKFCERCQKISHQCDPNRRQKVWKPKPNLKADQGKQNTSSNSTPIQEAPRSLEEADEGKWTVVQKRGKAIDVTDSSNGVHCLNGFGVLRALNGPQGALDSGPFKADKAYKIREKLCLRGKYLDKYTHHGNGRIWIDWDDNKVDIRHVKSSSQFIYYSVHDMNGNFPYLLTAVYAHNQLNQRKNMWQNMEDICKSQQGPWCAVGDYNNVVTSLDRSGGNLVIEAEFKDLRAMMDNTGLHEMDSTGDFYTWSNKQANNPIYSRIDRVLANLEWLQDHSDVYLVILPPHISDHAILHLNKPGKVRKTRQFRFNNCWVDAIGYIDQVQRSWDMPMSGTPMQRLWKKLMSVSAFEDWLYVW